MALWFVTVGRAEKLVSAGIAVIVNDSIITYQDVELYIGQAVDLLRVQYGQQPEVLRQKISQVQQDGMEQLVERQLILHEFKTAGYNFPASIIDDTIEERIKAKYRNRVTFIQDLRVRQQTWESFHQQQHDEIVVDAMRRRNVPQDTLISPQKILDYYEANKTNFAVGEQVRLRMIMLTNQPANPGASKQLATEILGKIKEGASFAEMANVSNGPQRESGGLAGWAERDQLRKELADVAFALKKGDVSDVIELPESCWLLKLEDKKEAHIRPLAEVQDEIERTLRINEAVRLQKKWITRLKEKAFVRYF
jgi:parvulin-like peptidyl-prolyl isomerase